VKNITSRRVHRLGGKIPNARRPRLVVAKFEHFKQKELVRSRSRKLKGTDYSMNDQFPKEILERRRVLFPISEKVHGRRLPWLHSLALLIPGDLKSLTSVNHVTIGGTYTV